MPMRAIAITLVIMFAFAGVVAVAPAANAAPPNIGGGGCDYFHWHSASGEPGSLPGYHWHPCM